MRTTLNRKSKQKKHQLLKIYLISNYYSHKSKSLKYQVKHQAN